MINFLGEMHLFIYDEVIPMVPNSQTMRLYSEQNVPLAIQFLSPMHQCYEFIVHPSRGILYIYILVYLYSCKYIYILSPFYTQMATYYTNCSVLGFFFF